MRCYVRGKELRHHDVVAWTSRRRLFNQGISVSARQLDAFLSPSLSSADGAIDYNTFASLARPRAPLGVKRPSHIRPADFTSDGTLGPNTYHNQVRVRVSHALSSLPGEAGFVPRATDWLARL